ncbi:hypothetical protein AAA075_19125, partial [Bacteroides intestinalis]|uniref:hypothetical protein n=1 Tax=Bacteroides intestinalis TaxID=329854 RepID=UPI0032C0CCEF
NFAITKYFMPKDTKTLGNSKARACESLGFVHKKGCARVLTQPPFSSFFQPIIPLIINPLNPK